VATIIVGLTALALAAAGLRTPRGTQGLGAAVAKMIVVGAAVAFAALEFKPAAKGRFLLTLALAWTAVMGLVVWW
jgi:hypothetical protein